VADKPVDRGVGSQPPFSTPPPKGWVVMAIPNELRLGPLGIAERCSWDLSGRPDGMWEVRLKERAWSLPRQIFQPQLLLRAADAGRPEAYAGLARLLPQDEYISETTRRLALAEAERLLAAESREAAWEALGLLAVGAADAELPSRLQGLYALMAPQLQRSSIWTIPVDPVYESRRSLVRVLVAAADAPETLRVDREFEGLKMGRGLTAPLSFLPLMKMALLPLAPGVLGLAAARATGLVVLLFGKLEAGRSQVGQSSLIDLYRPSLLATPVTDTMTFPKPNPAHVEELLVWWCERLNAIHDVLLDPARYARGDSTYDPTAHYGDLISFDRLVAAVNTILVGSRREEFSRRLMLFQALDILEGFRQGTYATLLDRDVLASHIEKLRARIPKSLQPFLLPRCERALEALKAVDRGWLKERVGPQGLAVMTRVDQSEFRPLKRAAADYVRLVRNAGHALRKSLEAPENRSLLVSHTGDLPPELSDLAFLHFLRLLVEPDVVKQVPVEAT
jgi:hypothetical protein